MGKLRLLRNFGCLHFVLTNARLDPRWCSANSAETVVGDHCIYFWYLLIVNLCQLSVQTDETFGFGHCEDANQKGLSNFGSIVTRTALHFSMLEVAPSAKTVVTCSKARRLVQQSTAVVLYRKACLVPKSIAPKAFLHWDSLKCRAGTIPTFHHSIISSWLHIP